MNFELPRASAREKNRINGLKILRHSFLKLISPKPVGNVILIRVILLRLFIFEYRAMSYIHHRLNPIKLRPSG